MSKPNLFIGCSTEGIEVARILDELLAHDANVNIWTADTFHPGDTMIDALVVELDRSDYAILVLTPDDHVVSRREELPSPRDNVVFEAGFFMGRLGRKRTFLVRSRGAGLKIPTDWDGLVFSSYDGARFRENQRAALGPTANEIRRAMQRNVHPKEIEFIRAYLTFVEPGTRLTDTYSRILSRHYNRLCAEVERLEARGDWKTLLQVKIRLREYFEYSGKYLDGVEFGRRYVRALEVLGDVIEAHWARVKHVAYLLILAGKHQEGRDELQSVMQSLLSVRDVSDSTHELLFYCYRYLGISYQRDEVSADADKVRSCFDKAQEFVDSFAHEPVKQQELQARLLGNYGNLALHEGEYSKALGLYERSHQIFKERGDTEHIGITHLKIAEALVESSTGFNLAPPHLDRVEDIAIRIDWFEGQGRIYYLRAALHERLAEDADGLSTKATHLRESLSYATKSKTVFRHIDARRWLGRAEEMIKRIQRRLSTGIDSQGTSV